MLSLIGLLAGGGRPSGQLSGGAVLDFRNLYEMREGGFDITSIHGVPIVWTTIPEGEEDSLPTEIIKFRAEVNTIFGVYLFEMILQIEDEETLECDEDSMDMISNLIVRNMADGVTLLDREILHWDTQYPIKQLINVIQAGHDELIIQEFIRFLMVSRIIQFRAPPTPETVPVAAPPGGSPGFQLGGGEKIKIEKVMTLEEATDIELPLI